MKKRSLLIIAVGILLSGCSSFLGLGENNFACAGLPQGAKCLSAMDVLKATDYKDHITEDDISYFKAEKAAKGIVIDDKSNKNSGDRRRRFGSQQTSNASPDAAIQRAAALKLRSAAPAPDRNIPIRTQPVIMRIWIAPWEDDQNFLNMAGYTYTEIKPREWAVGEPYTGKTTGSLKIVRQDPKREKKVKKKADMGL